MKKGFQIFTLLIFLAQFAIAQSENSPFHLLDKQVKDQQGGWAGSKEDLSKIFNAERIRLEHKFEPEVLKYLGTDVEKHYWISSFLVIPSYLHGNKPMPYLALLINQQGISLLRNKADEESLGDTLKLSVTAAILSQSIGLHGLAESYKKDAERILAKSDDFKAWFPGLSSYNRCLYSIIGKQKDPDRDVPPCKQEEAADINTPRILRVGKGLLEQRATNKPQPIYPAEAKQKGISGEVIVEVLIDEGGKVESARVLDGHLLLQKAAIEAAYQTRFEMTQVQGQPIKVVGVLTYTFKK